MTGNIMTWVTAFGLGAAAGALYFALLWHSVRTLTEKSRSLSFDMVVFYLKVLARITLVCAGILLAVVLEAPLAEIALAVAGFLAARIAITALVRRQGRRGV